jgi:hypothetical protein
MMINTPSMMSLIAGTSFPEDVQRRCIPCTSGGDNRMTFNGICIVVQLEEYGWKQARAFLRVVLAAGVRIEDTAGAKPTFLGDRQPW